MSSVNDMNEPRTTKEVQKSARKDRLARALKANIKRRKATQDKPGDSDDGRKD